MLTMLIGSMVAHAQNQCVESHTGGAVLDVPSTFPTITDAVIAANDGDLILIDAGIYQESVDLLGKSLTLQGAGCGVTTLFTVNGPGLTIEASKSTVHDMTITGEQPFRGAFVEDSGVLFERVCFEDLGSNGGGIARGAGVDGYASDVCLRESLFLRNEADEGGGVAITNGPGNYLQVEGTTFVANAALVDGGGAIHQEGGTLYMDASDFQGNRAALKGGGIWTSATEATVIASNFQANTALGGGGMSFFGGTLQQIGGAFESNAAQFAGGLEIGFIATKAVIQGTAFSNNVASVNSGAGILADGVDLELDATVFSNNTATHLGGGVYQWREGPLTIRNATFSDNRARSGGGVYYDSRNVGTLVSDVRIQDSVFERNQANPTMSAVAEGGALTIARALTLDVERTLFRDNVAINGVTQRGGTMRLVYNDTVTARDNFVCGGAATNGGAVHSQQAGVQETWHNNIFVNNTATTHAGAVLFNESPAVDFAHNTVMNSDADRTAAVLFTSNTGATASIDQNVFAHSDADATIAGTGAIGAWDATTESIVDAGWGTNSCHDNQPADFTSIFTGPPTCDAPGTDPLPQGDPAGTACDQFSPSDFELTSDYSGLGADPSSIPFP